MPIDTSEIRFLCGSASQLERMSELKRLKPFSDTVCYFLSELSALLIKHPRAKEYPDVVTFGFFCRRSSISQMKERYSDVCENRLGKGVTFHIAPSNVPINFAYSMAAALLAGNSCIIRVSSKDFEQTDIVCECIKKAVSRELADHISVIKYPKSKEINDHLSSISNVRVVWGGDDTIEELRRSPLPPRASEITFANRYSIAVISSKAINECKDLRRTVKDFYNDTYLYDQNACSSPRLIYWLGGAAETAKAREKFWSALHGLVSAEYALEPAAAVDKYTAECRAAIELGAKIVPRADDLISRIEISRLAKALPEFQCAGGSFIEFRGVDLEPLKEIVTEKYQTLSYFGADKKELADFVISSGLKGIDRIVPIGKASDFRLLWDGYDLITEMSRVIDF